MFPAILSRVLALSLLLLPGLTAQFTFSGPDFQSRPHATGLNASGERMAADRFGNVYILDLATVSGHSITRIRPDGTVDRNHVTGLAQPGQLATSPVDGLVYLIDGPGPLAVFASNILRIEPSGGATNLGSVPIVGQGLTIDDQGLFVIGGNGLGGPGLFLWDGMTPPVRAHRGAGTNGVLQSLGNGEVLVADGRAVQAVLPGTNQSRTLYQHPFIGNTLVTIGTLARHPWNAEGKGALLGVNEFTTLCTCGVGLGIWSDVAGVNQPSLVTESYASPRTGFRALCAGPRRQVFWYTDDPNGRGGVLHEITRTPTMGTQGSLIVQEGGASIFVSLYGPTSGNDPFLLGIVSVPMAVPAARFYPLFGVVDLDPFGASYFPLVDGVGVFGPPSPIGRTSASGDWSTVFTPGAPAFTVDVQALILSTEAPNGAFFISNVYREMWP